MTERTARPLSEVASEPTFRTIDGLSIRFVESDRRDVDALLFSPWPESVFAYEPMWSRMAETAHLVAVDLPGFGRSEGNDALMTPRAMGHFIVRVADEFQLRKPHVIAPDIGTSASLFAAATHPNRFLSLVVGTGGAAVPIELGNPLREWVFAQDLEPYRRIGGRAIVERTLQTLERYKVTDAAREDYLASFEGDRFAESIRYVQSYPTELEALRAALPQVQTPVQIISGRRDTVVPPINAEYLHERLPHSGLHLIDATHFIWEDAADEYARLVNAWWAGGFTTCMKTSNTIATGNRTSRGRDEHHSHFMRFRPGSAAAQEPMLAERRAEGHSIGGITMHPLRKLRESGKATPAQVSALLAENIRFNSPILVRPIEGREAVAAIFAQSSSTRGSGTYTAEFKLDERTTFLRWEGTMEGHKIESVEVIVDNEQGLMVERTVALRPYPAVKLFRDAMYASLKDKLPPDVWDYPTP